MTNRFKHLAQSYIEDNKDILTLPDDQQSPDTTDQGVNTPEPINSDPGALPSNNQWDFNTLADPATFDDDVDALIDHLSELEVPLSVVQAAIEKIQSGGSNTNQSPQTSDQLEAINLNSPSQATE